MTDRRAFADLPARLASGAVLVGLGGPALWLGGVVFAVLVAAVAGLMTWELARMVAPDAPRGRAGAQGAIAALLVFVLSQSWGGWIAVSAFVLAAVLFALNQPRHRKMFGAYLALILLAGHALIALRDTYGLWTVLWLIAVVVASDVSGYLAGRLIGGPKFWPAISPNKTWSGTVAGWLAAALVGALFGPVLGAGLEIALVSALLAFAGQLGDIAESAIKRREGVKDSSRLIPGHGGVMDRFDALLAVVVCDLIFLRTGLLPL